MVLTFSSFNETYVVKFISKTNVIHFLQLIHLDEKDMMFKQQETQRIMFDSPKLELLSQKHFSSLIILC